MIYNENESSICKIEKKKKETCASLVISCTVKFISTSSGASPGSTGPFGHSVYPSQLQLDLQLGFISDTEETVLGTGAHPFSIRLEIQSWKFHVPGDFDTRVSAKSSSSGSGTPKI